jgi:aminoglycoside phosphotransferase (APT) family kinase protein
MTESTGALELLRARALGFFTPRPGRRPAPRQAGNPVTDFQPDRTALAMLGLTADRVVRVERCASRRVVLMVELADGSACLVKFPDTDTELDNDYERVVLGMLEELELSPRARRAVPRLVACGNGTRAIALDVIKDCDSLRELTQRDPEIDVRHLVNLAAALVDLHQAPVQDAYRKFPEWLLHPPVPMSTQLTPYEYAHGAGLDFDVYLRVMQELEAHFRELHEQWRPDTIVHYDLRDDNILFPHEPGADCVVRLIDWELAGFGDPCYDVGYLVGQFLVEAVRRHGDTDALSTARRNARTFLSAYRTLSGITGDTELRVLRYAGVSLLLQAAMRLQQLGMLTQVGHLCLLYGKRLIADPTLKAIMK